MSTPIYTLPNELRSPSALKELLLTHPEIQFISLTAVDFGNNHTDEKIPVSLVIDSLDSFLVQGIQTDGSSVHLPEIATINNAKVDLIPDMTAHWIIDYNYQNLTQLGKPVGTLIIPAFLSHNNTPVCSRSVLKKAIDAFKDGLIQLFLDHPNQLKKYYNIDNVDEIQEVVLTSATELEFWVKTPETHTDIEKLTTSQNLKEQYWKRTYGQVRTALEQSLSALDHYGFIPEMGHKEVGGVTSKLAGTNMHTHIMEQLEIDWQYDQALNTADKEMIAKDIIKDIFERNGLSVTFEAKPLEGIAGSGEHHHVGVALKLKNGKMVNLFSPIIAEEHFMNPAGYGALMGILKNYEVINPFVSCTNDSLNRLKPGFEAPVCIVSSLGLTPDTPSRNRTVLIGLIRDMNNPMATRFELRSPNPNSNSYLLLAAVYQASLDGIRATFNSGLTNKEIEDAFNKAYGDDHFYLEKNRVYRSEEDVFEDYTDEERNLFFGTPPKTVYENLLAFDAYQEKVKTLLDADVFSQQIISSYKSYMLSEWLIELGDRIIPNNRQTIRRLKKLHGEEDLSDLDIVNWERIKALKHLLMKDSMTHKSMFTQIKEALENTNYALASKLQLEMNAQMSLLTKLYMDYRKNLIQLN